MSNQQPEKIEEALTEWEKTVGESMNPQPRPERKVKQISSPPLSPLTIVPPPQKVQQQIEKAQKNLQQNLKLSVKEINSIAHDLQTYFTSETLQSTLKQLGQEPTGKNAKEYAQQLAEIAKEQAIVSAYEVGGSGGLKVEGKNKEESLGKERLLEEKGYQILRDLYARLKRELKEKEQELQQLVSTLKGILKRVQNDKFSIPIIRNRHTLDVMVSTSLDMTVLALLGLVVSTSLNMTVLALLGLTVSTSLDMTGGECGF